MYPPPHMMHLSLLIPNSHPPPGYLPHSRPLPLARALAPVRHVVGVYLPVLLTKL